MGRRSGRPKGQGSHAQQKLWQDFVRDVLEDARRQKVISQVPRWPEGQKVALGYSRVSTDEQRDLGTSLEGQAKVCEEFYRNHLDPNEFLWKGILNDESVSATKRPLFERPQGQMILTLRPGDVVIFPVFDRAFRTMRDFVLSVPVLQKLGIKVHLLDFPIDINTPEGQYMLAMRAATAEFEAKMIARRMAAGREIRKLQGRPWNHCPRGFKIVGKTATCKGFLKPDWEWRAFCLAGQKLLDQGEPGRVVVRMLNRKWCKIHDQPFLDTAFVKYPFHLITVQRFKQSIALITKVEGSDAWIKMTPVIKLD